MHQRAWPRSKQPAAEGLTLLRYLWLVASLAVVFPVCLVSAAPQVAQDDPEAARRASERIQRERARVRRSRYAHWFGSLALGRGLRFNNPYRLERVLGSNAESLSLSALYVDLALGVAQGDPSGLQHGVSAHLSTALTGIRQEVLTPSYQLLYRPHSRWLWLGRFGVPVVLEPDVTAGFEAGAGVVWRFLGGVGLYSELVGSLFFGAATLDSDRTTIPLLSLQVGMWGEYEVFE